MDSLTRIGTCGIVPVVVIDDAQDAVPTARALLAGGVDVMEITLRTPAGLDAIGAVAQGCPEMLVGAGTVLSLAQCRQAVERGAKFIVSPGYDPAIVDWCVAEGVAVLPGCVTPTEITATRNAGLSVVKFFPANVYGGVKAIKALSGPFQDITFVPTGGVGLGNLAEFVTPAVFAIGGGFLCDKAAVNSGDWEAITQVCRQSVDIVKQHR